MLNRPITANDLPALRNVLDHCTLFPSEYLEEMIADYLTNTETEHIWLATEIGNEVVSLAYCAPMALTDSTYNLYAIGVHDKYQGQGVGKAMMNYIEDRLRQINGRVLIVETSSSEDQTTARHFYKKCGYALEATLRDFWAEGEDKIVFWKKL